MYPEFCESGLTHVLCDSRSFMPSKCVCNDQIIYTKGNNLENFRKFSPRLSGRVSCEKCPLFEGNRGEKTGGEY